MNYKKIILVGCISAFVAVLTSVMGVAGTIIGSVISSVLYNMLTEALEKPVGQATFSTDFEWEIAYIFPLVVIALIQLLFILALLSDWGFLPYTFLNVYLSIQHFADNNLFRILGMALLIISAYPIVLKPDIIKKSHGAIIAIVGVIFLARGFVDFGNQITNFYSPIFIYFDFPIAVVSLILIVFVIINILRSAHKAEKEHRIIKHAANQENFYNDYRNKSHHSKKHGDFNYNKKVESIPEKTHEPANKPNHDAEVTFKDHIDTQNSSTGINESSENIRFESNDLLDEYKK